MRAILSIVFLGVSGLAWGGPTLDRLAGGVEQFPSVADVVAIVGLQMHPPWRWAQDALATIGGLDLGLVALALALAVSLLGDAHDYRQ